jgi:hypothetical protein
MSAVPSPTLEAVPGRSTRSSRLLHTSRRLSSQITGLLTRARRQDIPNPLVQGSTSSINLPVEPPSSASSAEDAYEPAPSISNISNDDPSEHNSSDSDDSYRTPLTPAPANNRHTNQTPAERAAKRSKQNAISTEESLQGIGAVLPRSDPAGASDVSPVYGSLVHQQQQNPVVSKLWKYLYELDSDEPPPRVLDFGPELTGKPARAEWVSCRLCNQLSDTNASVPYVISLPSLPLTTHYSCRTQTPWRNNGGVTSNVKRHFLKKHLELHIKLYPGDHAGIATRTPAPGPLIDIQDAIEKIITWIICEDQVSASFFHDADAHSSFAGTSGG